MTSLVERLRDADVHSQQRFWGGRIFGEAADEIERLRAALERLGSSETLTQPVFVRDNSEGKELRARIDFARAALKGDA